MLDFVAAVSAESDLFNQSLRRIWDGPQDPARVSVPSCPDWSAADLAWHLAEVQYFWASIVDGPKLDVSEVTPLERPADAELLDLHFEQAAKLVELLSSGDPDEPCWSWYQGRQSVEWVRRRQAHEALIHRIDADLTAEAANGDAADETRRAPVDETLAGDGIDELLTVMLDVGNPPQGGSFDVDGPAVALKIPERSWHVDLGHLVATDDAGAQHRHPAIQLGSPSAAPSGRTPDATLTCSAAVLDLWLWRRGPLQGEEITGDRAAIEQLHALAAIA